MEYVIFGLTVSSSWGNGHAALWRGLIRALHQRGHRVVFFERDVPCYAEHRDLVALPDDGELVLYEDWEEVRERAARALALADVAIVSSSCMDALDATRLMGDLPVPRRVFYDLDTPITLDGLRAGDEVPYLGPDGLRPYDLVLSYTGGRALEELRTRLGAARVAPLYGHVDPAVYRPVSPSDRFRCDLSYLGTYTADRQPVVQRLLVEPARRAPARRFLLGGAQYPSALAPTDNLSLLPYVPLADHPAFFCSSRLTLNVTRRAVAERGYCPSGRLFEAAACGAPLLTDSWEGLETFFTPGEELLVARDTSDTLGALELGDAELSWMGRRARERALDEHTPVRRAEELEQILST